MSSSRKKKACLLIKVLLRSPDTSKKEKDMRAPLDRKIALRRKIDEIEEEII